MELYTADKHSLYCQQELTELYTTHKHSLYCRQELADLYKQIIQQLQVVQKQVLDEEMIRWKRRQQLGGNGKPTLKTELDMLQQW